MFGRYLALGAIAAMVSVASAFAAEEAPSKENRASSEIVCEKTEVLGSRLGTKRVCMTRAEWAERRRLERQEIEKAQVQRGSCEGCP